MIEPILARRSIRKYTDEPVGEDQIHMLLDAAMAAPSGKNIKPWHFVVVTERSMLDALADSAPYWKMLHEAPLAIIVCGAPSESRKYWDQDSFAATENILIAATMMGLGSVWLGCHPNDDRISAVRNLTAVPEEIVPVAVLAIGHPDEHREARTQYDGERVHMERW
jgi:nitroreductase